MLLSVFSDCCAVVARLLKETSIGQYNIKIFNVSKEVRLKNQNRLKYLDLLKQLPCFTTAHLSSPD